MKWNKKICIQYLTEMRSPIEEAQKGAPGNTPQNPLKSIVERLMGKPGE